MTDKKKPKNRNDITGDKIQTGVPTEAYRTNHERIFGNHTKDQEGKVDGNDSTK